MISDRGWLPVLASGRVHCVRRGTVVDLARCLDRSWLEDLDRATAIPAVRCSAVTLASDVRRSQGVDEHVD
jgi:hypothetical protein